MRVRSCAGEAGPIACDRAALGLVGGAPVGRCHCQSCHCRFVDMRVTHVNVRRGVRASEFLAASVVRMSFSGDRDDEPDREEAEADARSLEILTDPAGIELIAAYRQLLDDAQRQGNLAVVAQAKPILDNLLRGEALLAQRNAESRDVVQDLRDKRRVREDAERELEGQIRELADRKRQRAVKEQQLEDRKRELDAAVEHYQSAVKQRRDAERAAMDKEQSQAPEPSSKTDAE